jgi:phosphate transport system substrate-binding protein
LIQKKRGTRWLLVILAACLSLVAAACGDDDGGSTEGGGGNGGGSVTVTGSSTVEPISSAAAEVFAEETGTDIDVEGPGTGDGFQKFCAGDADVADASRPISAEEVAACEEGGVEYIELKVAIDGIAVLTNPSNAVECLSFADLYALIGPESQGVDTWSAAQELATELGSDTQLPDQPLSITGPGEESGTYDSFIEIAFGDVAEARVEAGATTEDDAETTRPDYTASANDNTIIQGISEDDGSLGWVGFSYAEEAGEDVKEVQVAAEPGGECVEPTAETIQAGDYPLARDLYIYVDATKAEENQSVADYVDFYLEGLTEFVQETGYVTLPEDAVSTTRTTWEDRTTGTTDGGE